MNRLSKKKKFLVLIILIISDLVVGISVISKSPLFWDIGTCETYNTIEEIPKGKFYAAEANPTHIGGDLVVGFLSIPFYHFFHSPYLAYHYVNLLLSIFMLLVTFFLLERFFDYKIALIETLFFVFVPSLSPYFIINLRPRYYLPLLLGFLAIFMFYTIFFNKTKKEKHKHFAVLGFLLGFSIWINFLIIPTIIFILFFWFVFDKKFFLKKNFIIFTIFLIIGSSLIIPYYLTHKVDYETIRVLNRGYDIFSFQKNPFDKFKEVINNLIYYSNISSIFWSYFTFAIFTFSLIFLTLINYKKILGILKDIIFIKSTQKLNPEILIIFYFMMNFLIMFLTTLPLLSSFTLHSLFIITSIALIRLPKKLGKIIGFIIVIIMIGIGLNGLASKLVLTEEYTQFYTESCYDITGYNIAFRYWNNPLSLEENCNKMDDNKYYCYKAAGYLIGQNILNLSSAHDYCEKLKFKEWCYEGFYEEMGSHLAWNLTLIKTDILLYYHDEKWNNIFLPGDIKNYNISNLTININGCKQIPEKYKLFCYYGIAKVWSRYKEILEEIRWDDPINIRENMKVCDLIDNVFDRSYCYTGFFKRINTNESPFVTNPEICEAMGIGCDYFCYEGISKEIAFMYPNVSVAEYACKKVSNDETFLNICYRNIGYYLGNRFRYNLSYANEYCNNLDKDRETCLEGIEDFLNEVKLATRSCNLNNTIYVSGSNLVIDCNNSKLEGFHNNKDTPPWSVGLSIQDSNNITIRNCEISNFTVNLLIERSSDVVIENVTLHDGFMRNLFGNLVDNLILKNVTTYNAWRNNSIDIRNAHSNRHIEIIDSEIYNSKVGLHFDNIKNVDIENNQIYDITDSGMTLNNIDTAHISNNKIKTKGLHFDNIKNVDIENNQIYDITGSGMTLNNIDTAHISNNKIKTKGISVGIKIFNSNFVINSSTITGQQTFSKDIPWSIGVIISNTNNGILRNCEIQNHTVNVFLENTRNILLENLVIRDSNFRNLFGKSVDNIILKNITTYNAWIDNSIDFSDCCSKDIEIIDSSIYNSDVGIRLKNIENAKIKNTLIKNITKCSIVIEAPPEEVLLENVTYDSKCNAIPH
jgi:hypothetical protein